ncbi:hypothetical protein BC937DRAFT_87031 [Endogone sp. FLAS-F59071]|nr:hypothetical protein BC937DRAFT_87031 [Endogone sp. FLAS-F59071]|eukprot:RUS19724.1 hypothetical protein BC937DRAFT_87031 [Endogone sp. FLAS-F59071]
MIDSFLELKVENEILYKLRAFRAQQQQELLRKNAAPSPSSSSARSNSQLVPPPPPPEDDFPTTMTSLPALRTDSWTPTSSATSSLIVLVSSLARRLLCTHSWCACLDRSPRDRATVYGPVICGG